MSDSKPPKDSVEAAQEASAQLFAVLQRNRESAASDPRFRKNPPTYAARCAEWGQRDFWTLPEAANLLCATDPDRPHPIEGQDALNAEVLHMRQLLARSDVPSEGRMQRRYPAKQVLAWAKRKGFEVPEALRVAMGAKPQREDKPAHGNALINAEKRQKVLGAALVAVIKYPAQCKGRGDKYTGRSIAEFLEQRAFNLFEDKVAPFSVDTMARLINQFLSDDPSAGSESA